MSFPTWVSLRKQRLPESLFERKAYLYHVYLIELSISSMIFLPYMMRSYFEKRPCVYEIARCVRLFFKRESFPSVLSSRLLLTTTASHLSMSERPIEKLTGSD